MIQKYGVCICHGRKNPINSKGLCPEGARDKREYSAASKGILTKSARNNDNLAINEIEDEFDSSRGSHRQYEVQQSNYEARPRNGFEVAIPKKASFKKTYIQPRSEKNKELVKLELLMFKQIWEERPHFCEVTGKPLGAFDVRMFSHVLTKQSYPRFRLYKKNIVLCLYEWHHKWEFETRKIPELSWIETLESALKTEYYKK